MQRLLKKASFGSCTTPSWSCTPASSPGSRSLARNAASSGFTLLEMLVVIVVMALLMGITFRMMKPSERARTVSSTIKTLNLTHAAIAEYHAEYGIYPPVIDKIPYKTKTTPSYTPHGGINVEGEPDNGNKCGFIPGVAVGYWTPAHLSRKYLKDVKPRDSNDQFVFGLASFLVDRRDPTMNGKENFLYNIFSDAGSSELKNFFDEGSHWYEYGKGYGKNPKRRAQDLFEDLEPAAKDVAFYKRIRGITSKIISNKSMKTKAGADSPEDYFYYTIRDAYGGDGHDLVYICPPPFTSYALFSAGADGKVVTSDPLNPDAKCKKCGAYHNRDNIYATVNTK
ncbi:MAG: type II secretion system protein [Kiritimatiellae bacterium]|nr:type II secretion system protein [Kiritimatiellia bacterium]